MSKCLVCKSEVVWTESFGWLHWDKKKKRGVYHNEDNSGHKAVSVWE